MREGDLGFLFFHFLIVYPESVSEPGGFRSWVFIGDWDWVVGLKDRTTRCAIFVV